MKTDIWMKQNMPSMENKTVAISGATGGIGQELCRHLASLGASLLLLDRNSERSNAWIEKLKAEFPALNAKHLRLDLADFDTVKAVTEELLKSTPDYLIFNAGAYHVPRYTTSVGHDNVFQINFLAPYYMARTLLPVMKERGGRIVAVGSIAQNYSKTDPTDRDFRTRKKASLVYGNAKRHLMYALTELFADEESASLAITHPGITFTNITSHYPKLIFALIKHPMKVIFMKPKRASLSILRGLFETPPKGYWIGPRVFDVWGLPRTKRLHTCDEREKAFICAEAERVYQNLCGQEGRA